MQRLPRGLQCISNETVEFDLVEVGSRFSADEIQVFAVAFSSVAKTQGGTALEHDMAKDAGIGQCREQMKVDRFLYQVLLHFAWDAMADHEIGDRTPDATGLAVHDFSLRQSLRPEFPRQ